MRNDLDMVALAFVALFMFGVVMTFMALIEAYQGGIDQMVFVVFVVGMGITIATFRVLTGLSDKMYK